VGVPVSIVTRGSALVTLGPNYGPEVLAQKSRDIAARFGAAELPADEAYKYEWDGGLFEWFSSQPGRANWPQVLAANPEALEFQYRSHTVPMTGLMLHDDLLTPGMIESSDPPPEETGMVRMRLDSRGRLLWFERIPEQLQQPAKDTSPPSPDWTALFTAAGLDQSQFQPAEPLWTSLAASDTRMAWTRSSPRSQRVEAASLRGKPVFFAMIEPWTKPDRVPGAMDSTALSVTFGILAAVLVIILVAAVLLAIGNLRRRRGDQRGAFRLAVFTFCVQMALWAARTHITFSLGLLGGFLTALATSVFYGVVMWTVYMALEPYVRRRWPQTLISWSAVLIGRLRDAVVGRDVLIGCAAGAALAVVGGLSEMWLRRAGGWPNLDNTEPLAGARGFLSLMLQAIPHSVREALFFFLLIFLLRALLRNQWIAAVVYALIFSARNLADGSHPYFNTIVSFAVLFTLAVLVLRWGILTLCTTLLFLNLVNVPSARINAWYFAGTATVLVVELALAAWAFYTSLGGRALWKEEFFT
jgi:serine/threonine-protein kinase